MLICTFGDLLLDVVVRLDGPLVPDDDALAQTRVSAGGQAANVAAWAAALGGRARYIGKRGADLAGRLVAEELTRRAVEVVGPVTGRTGVVVSVVEVEGARSMASDRGSAAELTPAEFEPTWVENCDWLHISGYALTRGRLAATALAAATLARGAGARISVDASSWTVIRDVGPQLFRTRLEELRPTVIFATEKELQALGDQPWPGASVVVKRGSRGCTVLGAGVRRDLPAVPAAVIDSTGAGDAFAAGYLIGGPALALEAGARCASQLGAMP
ncbi:MAG: carbohydrate kinase family protein [Candidatus Dormibacteraeota bacterium]|nr:carbohydrate kinase family protein [Candidatus Dormibacteraeota bacterium]